MADFDSVFCPRCKTGFAPETEVCPICGISLVASEEPEDGPEPVILEDDISSLAMLRTASSDWIRHLQDELAQAGIPHRIELSGGQQSSHMVYRNSSFSIYVRPEDLARAKEIDKAVFMTEVPDSEGMRDVKDLDSSTCPACGSPLGENDRECRSCGLVISQDEGWRCPTCNERVEAEVLKCPHCGEDLEWSDG